MTRALDAVKLAALLACLLASYGARVASAIEVQLPGERRLDIHGFYETRLLFTGQNFPKDSSTFSQFRHVLDLETELEVFPDGFGPFDVVFAFTRWIISYDCIYQRGCGAFTSADSYGGDARNLVRTPKKLEDATVLQPYIGGLVPMRYIPGTLRSPLEELTPGDRFRDCLNGPGVAGNPFPLAVYCNAFNRSPLDAPIRPGAPLLARVQAGSFNLELRQPLLTAARSSIGEDRFRELFKRISSGQIISRSAQSERLASLAAAARLEAAGDAAGAAALRARATDLLHVNPADPTSPFLFEAGINGEDGGQALLTTRPDLDRFAILANSAAPDLLTAQWGAGQLGRSNLPYLGSIDTKIEPTGYFHGGILDIVGAYDEGLADDAQGGLGLINPAGGPLLPLPSGVNPNFTLANSIPFFTGPDGRLNTADDLPAVSVAIRPITLSAASADSPFANTLFAQVGTVQDLDGSNVELYGIFNRGNVARNGCGLFARGGGNLVFTSTGGCTDPSTGTSLPDLRTVFLPAVEATLTQEQLGLRERVYGLGCQFQDQTDRSGLGVVTGMNADGDCIRVNASALGSSRPLSLLPLLGDSDLRPADARGEPIDLTDLRSFGRGGSLPARPRAPDGGLYFTTPGFERFVQNHNHIVTNLDLDFNEDELRWDRGASQDEKEFKEGYLEFEMLDSQLFARLGKLIVVWGKTELFRNQDRNNPIDIGNGLFQPLEETRVGQWAANFTIAPEQWMRVGPVEDMRLELLGIFDNFEPTDLGKCGEGGVLALVCLKSFGAMASGLAGIGLVGEARPDKDYGGLERFDYGIRLEGRYDRFTFAVSDFWGWDDGFYIEVVNEYQRLNDTTTGAPLAAGGGSCTIQAEPDPANPGKTRNVGPDGVFGTSDDQFPTEGNCLLFTKNAAGMAVLRAPDEIARLHTVNQTIFHTVCTLTFDPDEGFCAFDRLNDPTQFFLVTDLLSGFGALTGAAVPGIETLRRPQDGISLQPLSSGITSGQFKLVDPTALDDVSTQNLSVSLRNEQKALLGCGPAYAAPCHSTEANLWAFGGGPNPANRLINPDPNTPLFSSGIQGGLDLMNADGSVVTQEFAVIKAFGSGSTVGNRFGVYSPGINFNRLTTAHEDEYLTQFSPNDAVLGDFSSWAASDPTLPATLALDLIKLRGAAARAVVAQNFETDGWIEPFPFKVDTDILEEFGALVFKTRIVNGQFVLADTEFNLIDPNGPDPSVTGDPNDFANVDGEYCAGWFPNPFAIGCTGLEAVSSNLERFLIPLEAIGPDRVFSPPETLEELANLSSNDFTRLAKGDPISGQDGLFAQNAFLFGSEFQGRMIKDARVIEVQSASGLEFDCPRNPAGACSYDGMDAKKAREEIRKYVVEDYKPFTDCSSTSACWAEVPTILAVIPERNFPSSPLADAIPISYAAEGDPNSQNKYRINLQKLQLTDPLTYAKLANGSNTLVEVPNEVLGLEVGIPDPNDPSLTIVATLPKGGKTALKIAPINQDLDRDGTPDLDRDIDGVLDSVDDLSAGPVTDDNIFCGSGIPGDLFQDMIQLNLAYADESRPTSLPPRSPVFCRSLVALAGATATTLPVQKAGGDGAFGRRDFLWQGGRQLGLRYQKRNVFGFGLDFAEDRTKSSWGIEYSWTANKLFSTSLEPDGLHKSDEMVLSVSIDRPTFFNFLNPNRSFFLNYQFFVRYLSDFDGSSGKRTGMYSSFQGPFSTFMVFTFFTGYFQDRLGPRLTLVYDPTASQGAAIAGLSYRWNESFSTSIGYNAFFGHTVDAQASLFPALQYNSPEQTTSTAFGRGVTPVLNEDNLTLRVRYSF